MFIAITPYQILTKEDLNHYIEISEHIDLLLLRTPMNHQNLFATIDYLITHGFPKNKIMLHTHTSLVATFDLKYVHFKENDAKAFLFKKQREFTHCFECLDIFKIMPMEAKVISKLEPP